MKYLNPNIKKYASRGGVQRATNLSKSKRSEIAKIAAQARWGIKHDCGSMCSCRVCGRPQFKHRTTESCPGFECENGRRPKIVK